MVTLPRETCTAPADMYQHSSTNAGVDRGVASADAIASGFVAGNSSSAV